MFKWLKKIFTKKPEASPTTIPVKSVPTDIEKQIDEVVKNKLPSCLNLLKFNPSLHYWQSVLKAMAFAESSFNVLERYEEKGLGKDSVTGLQNWSEGLFQLSYQDSKNHGLKFDWALDKNKKVDDPTKTIFNIFNQVDGALIILNKQLSLRGTVATETNYYWAVLNVNNKRYSVYLDQFNMYMNDKTPVVFEPVKEVPVVIIEQPKQESKKMKIAIIEGHGDKSGSTIDTGSLHYNGKTELTYTREVTKLLNERKAEIRHEIKTFKQFPSVGECAKEVIAWKPDVSFECHTNAYNGKAKGCQAQVLSNDPASFKFAKAFAEAFCKKFGRVLRDGDGVLEMGRKERGIYNLTSVEALPASVLLEPFFGDNKADYVSVEDYVNFLIEFFNSL